MSDKILILKNDRAGDLFTSLKLISSLISRYSSIKIYLSELNAGFSFFFINKKIKVVNFNLTIIDKLFIFLDILLNNYKKVYILTPKSFYFILPFIFRNIKFYSIVYDSEKKLRPSKYLRKYLYKYKIIYRNKINSKSYRDLQLDLLENNDIYDNDYLSLNIPKINKKLKNILPKKFIFFQFRYLFFNKLGWGIKEFDYIMSVLHKKYEYVLFSSDLESNKISDNFNLYFKQNYSIIDTKNYIHTKNSINQKTFYLEKVNALNLFYILKESKINVAKEGIVGHLSFFHQKKCHNLFNFDIKTKKDVYHQKISYSEWCKGMNFTFSFLNNDIVKSARKIYKHI